MRKSPLESIPGIWKSTVLLLNAANRIVNERLNDEMVTFNYEIEAREGWVLLAAQERPASQALIAECLGVNPNVMVGIVDRLEGKGLICRLRAENRREYRLQVTPKGRRMLASINGEWRERTLRIFAPFSEDDLALFRRLTLDIVEGHFTKLPDRQISRSTATSQD